MFHRHIVLQQSHTKDNLYNGIDIHYETRLNYISCLSKIYNIILVCRYNDLICKMVFWLSTYQELPIKIEYTRDLSCLHPKYPFHLQYMLTSLNIITRIIPTNGAINVCWHFLTSLISFHSIVIKLKHNHGILNSIRQVFVSTQIYHCRISPRSIPRQLSVSTHKYHLYNQIIYNNQEKVNITKD